MAAFNIDGHSLLSPPVKYEFEQLKEERLHEIQKTLANMEYLIVLTQYLEDASPYSSETLVNFHW